MEGAKRRDMGMMMVMRGEAREGRGLREWAAVRNSRLRGRRRAEVDGGRWREESGGEELDLGATAPSG